MIRGTWAFSLLLAACTPGSDAPPPTIDASPPDASSTECHYDCGGVVACRADGTVWVASPHYIPCEHWTGSCSAPNQRVGTCAGGCAVPDLIAPAFRFGFDDLDYVCRGTPPAEVGQACRVYDDDCRPGAITVDADGKVTQTYLDCRQNVCTAGLPPTVEGYLSPCEPPASLASGAEGYRKTGIVAACLVADDQAAGCVRTGRTVSCTGDWDCPQGATCDAAVALLDGEPLTHRGLCRPGLPGTPLVGGLTCP